MGLEGGPRLMKLALILFNSLVLIAGCVALGLGVWSLKSDYGAEEMSSITGSELYETACYVIIVGGALVIVVSFLGCCGAARENRCLLAMYFTILLVMLVLLVVGAVLGFVYKDELEEELEDEMSSTLRNKYGVDVDDEDNTAVTDVWNKIQHDLKCCGVSGGLNSNTSWYLWQQSKWFTTQITFEKAYVPNSCCNTDGGMTFNQCSYRNISSGMPPQEDPYSVVAENPALYSEGCIDKVKDEIEDHVIAIIIAAIVVLVVMTLSIIFSGCVFVQLGKQNMIV